MNPISVNILYIVEEYAEKKKKENHSNSQH